ncbi:MAG TPA: hypothetical protein VK149_12245 [Sideroxyarcus sp.]|nr:hypothetical protein [Sideroxyarcus sp.]
MKLWIRDKLLDLRDDLKRIHRSMTMWFLAAVGFLSEVVPQLVAYMPQLQAYLPEASYQAYMRVLLIGAFILRFKTDKALRHK